MVMKGDDDSLLNITKLMDLYLPTWKKESNFIAGKFNIRSIYRIRF